MCSHVPSLFTDICLSCVVAEKVSLCSCFSKSLMPIGNNIQLLAV